MGEMSNFCGNRTNANLTKLTGTLTAQLYEKSVVTISTFTYLTVLNKIHLKSVQMDTFGT